MIRRIIKTTNDTLSRPSLRPSFHAARALIQGVNAIRTSAYMPIMLLGNKIDLDPRREVAIEEGHQVSFNLRSVHTVNEE